MHSVCLHAAGHVWAMNFCFHWPAFAHASQRWSVSTQAGLASAGGPDGLAGVARDTAGWPAAGSTAGGLAAGGLWCTRASGVAGMLAANGEDANCGEGCFAHRPQLIMHSFFMNL